MLALHVKRLSFTSILCSEFKLADIKLESSEAYSKYAEVREKSVVGFVSY